MCLHRRGSDAEELLASLVRRGWGAHPAQPEVEREGE